ncbi:hypothetical protein CEE37_02365 [candidate division LCP-89 bacterium B3_LCP]|uniref:Secretion system C-terminal sorting domain-containing protein n=1 Tax=candidate division LCP-89 bacterium B3_LCP TaxID=2012998 RepID=A0A532V5S1_UNCL8|nr:MAG: hypothetical protein CEE37_02365 [candidate division LCP-89 bacterium B3_LCP]
MKRSLSILALIILFSFSITFAETITVSGDVSGTWSADTVLVVGEVRVPQEQTLTIEPGVKVMFQGFFEFIVDTNATLTSVGTETDSIVFASYAPGGQWGGIKFIDANDSSNMAYCIISDGSIQTGATSDGGGAIYLYYTNLTLEHCTLKGNEAELVDASGGAIYCYWSHPTISDCIIRDNWATDGGGLACWYSSPIVTDCDISNNYASERGGGVGCYSYSAASFTNCAINNNTSFSGGGGVDADYSNILMVDCDINDNVSSNSRGGGLKFNYCDNPILSNCEIVGNSADTYGGGIYCRYSYNPQIINCLIQANFSYHGGGIYLTSLSDAIIINCIINGNSASTHGGGLHSKGGSQPMVLDSYFGNNTSLAKGGGIYAYDGSLSARYCLFYNNSAEYGGGTYLWGIGSSADTIEHCTFDQNQSSSGAGIYLSNSSGVVKNSIISGSTLGSGFYFEILEDPQIAYCDIYDNAGGTTGGTAPPGFGILSAVNANGDSCDSYYNILMDPMYEDPVIRDYNLQAGSPCIDAGDPESQNDPDGTVADMGAFYYHQTGETVPIDGYCYLENQTIHAGTKVLFIAASPGAVSDSTFTNLAGHYAIAIPEGIYDISFIQAGYRSRVILGQNCTSPLTLPNVTLRETGSVCHISGSLNGTLDSGVYIVESNIMVNIGDSLYIEPGSTFNFNGDFYFQIEGYIHAAGGEIDSIRFRPAEGINAWQGLKFINTYEACLLQYCTIEGAGNRCIQINGSNPTLSHCTITGGASTGFGYGGGIYIGYSSTPILHYCIITNNSVSCGGGIGIVNSTANIHGCIIKDNLFSYQGGGIYNCSNSNTIVTNSIIANNSHVLSGGGGGGIHNLATITLGNCIITDNSANYSGGLHCRGVVNLINCIIARNIANEDGGGIGGNSGQNLTIDNCSIIDNIAQDIGGGLFCNQISPVVNGCVVAGNTTDQNGAGMYFIDSDPLITNYTVSSNFSTFGAGGLFSYDSNPNTINNIFSLNSLQQISVGGGGNLLVTYSTIQDTLWPGVGNIDEDPLFVNPDLNDYRLQWGSPCIDAGDPDPQYNDPDSTRADMGAFYFDQSVPVRILLSPHEIPYLIEPEGGTMDYTIQGTNIYQSSHDVTIWCDVELPDSTIYGPVLGPVTVTIEPGQTVERIRTQTVPAAAPMGVYHYNAYAVVDQDTSKDSFMFGKLGTVLNGSDSWGNAGDPLVEISGGQAPALPIGQVIVSNYPNPFNPTTVISFSLPVASTVKLDVFDISGSRVGVDLASTRHYPPGTHQITFDGSGLASGIYLYRLEAGEFTANGKMVLMK